MEIAVSVVLLVVSLFFILKGGDIFVVSASNLAKRTGIPQMIIGATIVSIATTLPELLVAVFSSIDGTTGLAIGNSLGTVVCNICLICGLSFVIVPTIIDRGGNLKYILYIISTVLVYVFAFVGYLEIWQAFILIFISILYFVFNVIDIKKIRRKRGDPKPDNEITQPLWLSIVLFCIGGLAIAGGAWLLVDKVTFLAGVIGVSDQFIGLTVVAIGTSLPELVTTITSIKKKVPYLGIGNIVGSCLLNLTLILGIARLTSWNYGMQFSKESIYLLIPFVIIISLIMLLPILIKKKTYRWQGFVLLGLYLAYVVYLVLNAFFPVW